MNFSNLLDKIISTLKKIIDYYVGQLRADNIANYQTRQYEGEDVIVAVASYIPFVSAAILILRKGNSEFVLVHSKQALILTILLLLSLMILPSLAKLLISSLLILMTVISAYKALVGRTFYIPLVSQLAMLVEV